MDNPPYGRERCSRLATRPGGAGARPEADGCGGVELLSQRVRDLGKRVDEFIWACCAEGLPLGWLVGKRDLSRCEATTTPSP